MEKHAVLDAAQSALDKQLSAAEQAAMQAYQSATDKENIAENKYDTLGLEASYLAHGQSKRVESCRQDLQNFRQLRARLDPVAMDSVKLGGLATLENQDGSLYHFLLLPMAGGTRLQVSGEEVLIVTHASPMGRSLIDREIGDEVPHPQFGVLEIISVS